MTTWLTINAGSSSLKFSVWQGQHRRLQGAIEQLGGRARLMIGRDQRPISAPTMAVAMQRMKTIITRSGYRPDIVAHRIVHGGRWYAKPVPLNAKTIRRLRSIQHLAPLHLPANLAAVKLAQRFWPASRAWGVFDTALYRDLPAVAHTYAIPTAIATKFQIRKYGFHGTSHDWAFRQTAKKLQRPHRTLSAVTIHLGAGSSLSLWRRGRVIDTSMGFTPLGGVPMMTRSGDLDPMISLQLQSQAGWTAEDVSVLLNERSGLFGLSGLKDMRDILQAAGYPVAGWPGRRRWSAAQRRRARLGLSVYLYNLQRTLSGYLGLLAHVDAVIFTGAVGQNPTIRRLVMAGVLRRPRPRVVTIPTDEEQAIADAVRRVIQ